MDMLKQTKKKPMRPQSHTKNYRQPRNAGCGRNSLPQGRTIPTGYSISMIGPENIHKVTLYKVSKLYLGIYMLNICMYVNMIHL